MTLLASCLGLYALQEGFQSSEDGICCARRISIPWSGKALKRSSRLRIPTESASEYQTGGPHALQVLSRGARRISCDSAGHRAARPHGKELRHGMAYSVATRDEDHSHRPDLGNLLGVLHCSSGVGQTYCSLISVNDQGVRSTLAHTTKGDDPISGSTLLNAKTLPASSLRRQARCAAWE